VPYETYKKVLQISAVHVYLTCPFVLSWSLLEAMAMECLIVGSDTAPENGVLVNFFDAKVLARRLVEVPEGSSDFRISKGLARKTAGVYGDGVGVGVAGGRYAWLISAASQTPAGVESLAIK